VGRRLLILSVAKDLASAATRAVRSFAMLRMKKGVGAIRRTRRHEPRTKEKARSRIRIPDVCE